MSISQGVKNRLRAYRNPVYLLYAVIGVILFIVSALIAKSGVGPIELALFRFFNTWGDSFNYFFVFVSWFGTIGMVLLVSLIALIRRHYANALKIIIGGVSAYVLAYSLKMLDIRARPYELITDVNLRESSIGTHGFPSGHAAVATVLALIAYQYLPKRWHRPVTITAGLVMISRLYLGVHFPIDLVGGFAVGLFCGGIVNFLFGSCRFHPVSTAKVKKGLRQLGLVVKDIKFASVDARGSTPYIVNLADGSDVFVKVIGRENNIADWFFKAWRKIIYRRLEDETPFASAKHQLEHEAYIANMALVDGVHTPRVLGVFSVDGGRWGQAQMAIPGKSLDKVSPDKITDNLIEEVWQQIVILHDANIVHRDLRCANVFLDKTGEPWLIDFGFSEAAMPHESKLRDSAELLASVSSLVGAKRSVRAAKKVLGTHELAQVGAYLSYSVLSSATSAELKKRGALLDELRAEVTKQLHIPPPKQVKMQRISVQSVVMFLVIAIGIFVLIPKLDGFRQSIDAIMGASLLFVALSFVFSFATYYFASLSYRALLFYPIPAIKLFIIQIASSFTSKLAPAGTGGIALNARFLNKNSHSAGQSGAIAGINNVLGFIGNILLLLVVIIFGSSSIGESFEFRITLPPLFWAFVGIGLLVAIGILVVLPKFRARLIRFIKGMNSAVVNYRHHPYRIVGSLIASILVTITYCAALYASAYALGVTLDVLQVLIVFTIGVAAASITPTPGGIGGAEAGLVAALTATGIESNLALAITLVYRFATYWLPIIPGFIAFRYALKRQYV